MQDHNNKCITKVKIGKEPLPENDSSPKIPKMRLATEDLNNLSREELICLLLSRQSSQTTPKIEKRKSSGLNVGFKMVTKAMKKPQSNEFINNSDSSTEEEPESEATSNKLFKKRQSNKSEREYQNASKPIALIKQEDSLNDSDINTFSPEDKNYISLSEIKSESIMSSYMQKTQMSWTEMLQEKYPKYQKQNLSLKLPGNAKYSLLLVPKNIEPQSLINFKLHLNKPTSNILNRKEYIFQPLPHKRDPVLINLHKPKLVVLESIIALQQYVPKLDLQILKVSEKKHFLFPEEIKERHPLFGIDYQEKIRLTKKVKKRLKEAKIKHRQTEEKMKKKSIIFSKNIVEVGTLSAFKTIDNGSEIFNSILDKDKQKKRKRESDEDNSPQKSPKKKKSRINKK